MENIQQANWNIFWYGG